MKRIWITLLALTLALSLFGCGKQAAQNADGKAAEENNTQPVAQETANTDAAGQAAQWRYVLTTETRTEEEKNDAGVLLATTSYELPKLTAVCDDATQAAPDAQRRICEVFNRRVEELSQGLNSAKKLAEGAQEQYNEMDEEYRKNFPTHSEELSVSANRQSGDLLEVSFQTYGFWGGAHGGSSCFSWHYDLDKGEFFELADLSDRPEELNRMIADAMVDAVEQANDPDSYFEDYAQTIRAKESFEVSFGADAMTVTFAQYEIAPYATGMPAFNISYDKLTPFLNARGQRLLSSFTDQPHLQNP